MRKLVFAATAILAMAGCSNPSYDPDLCDFYQSLGVSYESMNGYVPAETQADIDKFCER
jgi:hypothetical protein